MTGDNGILKNAGKARDEQADSTIKDAIILAWNEYQLEINVPTAEVMDNKIEVATTQAVQIKGELENSLISADMSFLDYLREEKKVIDEDGVINVEALTGQKFHKGNGTDGETDVYKVEEIDGMITLKYYGDDAEGESEDLTLWEISSGSEETVEYPEATSENSFYYSETAEVKITGIVSSTMELILYDKKAGSYYLEDELYRLDDAFYHEEDGQPIGDALDVETLKLYKIIPNQTKSDIVIPKLINNKEVVSLITNEDGFFARSNIKTIVIPYSVREIEGYLFANTPFLTTISFPEGKNPDLEIPDNKWGAGADVQILGKNGEVLR